MRNSRFLIAIVVILSAFVSCTKDPSGSDTSLSGIVVSGTWTVHLYSQNSTDLTATYAGYTFEFKTGGALTATKAGTTTSGTWAEVADSGKTKLVISWVGGAIPVALLEIEEDWVLNSKSSSLIELGNTSGSGVVTTLHFMKK